MERTNNIPQILKYEMNYWDAGYDYIIGADEVGRGCIAGPIVIAGVVWEKEKLLAEIDDEKSLLHKIRDSKKISKNIRYKLSHWIVDNALCTSKIEVSPDVIDEKGIQFANRSGMAEAILKCREQLPQEAKVVAFTDYLDIAKELNPHNIKCVPILHGDNSSVTVASASIVAKVHRDAYMSVVAHDMYPNYGFNSHVGYGTKKHFDAININGLSPIHRKSFLNRFIISS